MTCTRRVQAGFTLIELMVVMTIAAMLIGLGPPAYERLKEASQYRQVLRLVLSDLRNARQTAMIQGTPTRFKMDLTARRFGVEGVSEHELPQAIQMRAIVGQSSQDAQAVIVFLPDGGSTGGTVDILRNTGVGARVQVDWMMGHITQGQFVP